MENTTKHPFKKNLIDTTKSNKLKFNKGGGPATDYMYKRPKKGGTFGDSLRRNDMELARSGARERIHHLWTHVLDVEFRKDIILKFLLLIGTFFKQKSNEALVHVSEYGTEGYTAPVMCLLNELSSKGYEVSRSGYFDERLTKSMITLMEAAYKAIHPHGPYLSPYAGSRSISEAPGDENTHLAIIQDVTNATPFREDLLNDKHSVIMSVNRREPIFYARLILFLLDYMKAPEDTEWAIRCNERDEPILQIQRPQLISISRPLPPQNQCWSPEDNKRYDFTLGSLRSNISEYDEMTLLNKDNLNLQLHNLRDPYFKCPVFWLPHLVLFLQDLKEFSAFGFEGNFKCKVDVKLIKKSKDILSDLGGDTTDYDVITKVGNVTHNGHTSFTCEGSPGDYIDHKRALSLLILIRKSLDFKLGCFTEILASCEKWKEDDRYKKALKRIKWMRLINGYKRDRVLFHGGRDRSVAYMDDKFVVKWGGVGNLEIQRRALQIDKKEQMMLYDVRNGDKKGHGPDEGYILPGKK